MDTSRRTKIVATAGPATDNPVVLAEMLRAGVNVIRLNASHGNRDDLRRRLAVVREVTQNFNQYVGLLLDLGGPKIRIEGFVGGKVMLKEGDPFTLDTSLDPKAGTAESVGVAYKNLPHDVGAGDTLLLADGSIVLDVLSVKGTRIDTRVRIG